MHGARDSDVAHGAAVVMAAADHVHMGGAHGALDMGVAVAPAAAMHGDGARFMRRVRAMRIVLAAAVAVIVVPCQSGRSHDEACRRGHGKNSFDEHLGGVSCPELNIWAAAWFAVKSSGFDPNRLKTSQSGATRVTLEIRPARTGDEKLILTLLHELAAYEKLTDRFHITEAVIRRD